MSDKMGWREFWVCDKWDPIIAERRTFDNDPGFPSVKGVLDVYHVIEIGAVREIEEKLRVAEYALEYVSCEHCIYDNKDGHKVAAKALEKLRGGK